MMPNPPVVPVVPDFEAARTQSFWTYNQIYFGPQGPGKFVPKIDDIVHRAGVGSFRVASIDSVSHIPRLVPENMQSATLTGDEFIIGGSIGSYMTTLRALLNTNRVPFRIALDWRYTTKSSEATHIKIFKGTNIESGAQVVSAMYDSSGVMISENIPLQPITLPNEENLALKAPVVGNCTERLSNYESVTVVAYSSSGLPLDSQPFVIFNSDTVVSSDRSKKYVRTIELLSEYLSLTNSRMLEYPVGITIQSDALMARIMYNDGTSITHAIDDQKVIVHGLNDLVSTESGRTTPLLLTYRLDDDEVAEDTSMAAPDRTISTSYSARAITNDQDAIYNVKLFVVPTWVTGAQARWRLRYFLYNLERLDIFEVTDYIEVSANYPAFNGTSYGAVQRLSVAVNLQQVSNRYRYYRHVQPFDITLNSAGSVHTALTYWSINYTSSSIYGQGKKATVVDSVAHVGTRRVRVDNGYTVLSEWLNDMYVSLSPLINTDIESIPPSPTHVRVRIGTTWQREIEITDILNPIDNIDTVIVQGQDLRLEFIHRNASFVYELAMGSLSLAEL